MNVPTDDSAQAVMDVAGSPVPVWPQGQKLDSRVHPSIFMTTFADAELYHPELEAKILSFEAESALAMEKGLCGTKIYGFDAWDFPEAQLLNARAGELFRRVLDAEDSVIDLAWVNIYHKGDYCMPHSHMRTRASLVYFLQPGDQGESALDGRFCIVDPRLDQCCTDEAGRMTTPYIARSTPGTMLIFPSEVVHCVNPYEGDTPRITLSWNIDTVAIDGSPLPPA